MKKRYVKWEDWQIEQSNKYLGKIVTYKGITYQIVDCIEEKGIVTGKSFAGYQMVKIKKIPISEIKKYF